MGIRKYVDRAVVVVLCVLFGAALFIALVEAGLHPLLAIMITSMLGGFFGGATYNTRIVPKLLGWWPMVEFEAMAASIGNNGLRCPVDLPYDDLSDALDELARIQPASGSQLHLELIEIHERVRGIIRDQREYIGSRSKIAEIEGFWFGSRPDRPSTKSMKMVSKRRADLLAQSVPELLDDIQDLLRRERDIWPLTLHRV